MLNADYRGFFFTFPSLLEPGPGPWMDQRIYQYDPVEGWKIILDWMAAHNCNTLITAVPSFHKDRVFGDWSYHYLLKYQKFPEAKCFSDEFIDRQVETVRKICRYAASVGIKILLHAYNNLAPRSFVDAHQELAAKHAQTTGLMINHDQVDKFGFLVANICINEPVYQDFMRYCYRAVFDAVPELSGIIITPGEHLLCQCPLCTDDPPSDTKPHPQTGKIRRPKRTDMPVKIMQVFSEATQGLDKISVVRAWFAEDAKDCPDNVYYAVKHSVYDCIRGGAFDESMKVWQQRGKGLWIIKEIHGENAGRVAWHDETYYADVAQNIEMQENVQAVIGFINPWWSFCQQSHALQNVNVEAFAHFCLQGKSKNEWDGFKKFGEHAPVFKRALKTVSDHVLSISSCLWLGGEGYTFGWWPTFDQGISDDNWWPMCEQRTPPEEFRNHVFPLNKLGEYACEHAWEDGWIDGLVPKGEKSPLQVWKENAANLEAEEKAVLCIKEQVASGMSGEYQLIMCSLRIARALCLDHYHYAMAKLMYLSLSQIKDLQQQKQLAKDCLEHMKQSLKYMEQNWEAQLELPHGIMDFSYYLRREAPPFDSFEAASYTSLELRRRELEKLSMFLNSRKLL